MPLPSVARARPTGFAGGTAARGLLAALVLALGGCGKALTIPTEFPEPLVAQLPLRVGVYYAPEFRDYVYQDTGTGDSSWTIRSGSANVALFDRVFGRLFREAVTVDSAPGPGAPAGFDAFVAPAVEAFEIALPAQSGTNQYSVWIRYSLKVYGPDGALVTTWPISAYGQSGSATLQAGRSMETATVLAMRDAGATISIGFGEQKAIRKALLDEGRPEARGEPADDPASVPDAASDAEPAD